jgi:hypothetical protein
MSFYTRLVILKIILNNANYKIANKKYLNGICKCFAEDKLADANDKCEIHIRIYLS